MKIASRRSMSLVVEITTCTLAWVICNKSSSTPHSKILDRIYYKWLIWLHPLTHLIEHANNTPNLWDLVSTWRQFVYNVSLHRVVFTILQRRTESNWMPTNKHVIHIYYCKFTSWLHQTWKLTSFELYAWLYICVTELPCNYLS